MLKILICTCIVCTVCAAILIGLLPLPISVTVLTVNSDEFTVRGTQENVYLWDSLEIEITIKGEGSFDVEVIPYSSMVLVNGRSGYQSFKVTGPTKINLTIQRFGGLLILIEADNGTNLSESNS